MGSSILTSHGWCQLPWLNSFLLLSILLYATMVSCTGPQISYNDHCASIVPQSTPTNIPEFTTLPFPNSQNGYYNGGDRILNPNGYQYIYDERKTLLFRTEDVYGTHDEAVFKVDGSLIFYSWNLNYLEQDMTYARSVFSRTWSRDDALSFSLKGFWSKSTGQLCMVGSGSSYSREGNVLHHAAVLRLNGVRNSNTITSLVSGTLTSLDSADESKYFDPISLLIFPEVNYQYTKGSKESIQNEFSGEINIPTEKSSLSLQQGTTICSILARPDTSFDLEYTSDCNSTQSCNPFADSFGYLPRVMSLNTIQCSVDGQSIRVLMEFPNGSYVGYYRPFKPNATFIGEGTWNWKKKRLCVVACRILSTDGALDSLNVEDCSIRLTLRFPAIWSIRNITSMLGHIWSSKAKNTSGYFDRIVFRGTEKDMPRIPGLKYEYTVVDKLKNKSCSEKKPTGNGEGKYPDGYSYEMSFDMSVKGSSGETGWGSSVQLSVGDQISQGSDSFMTLSSLRPASSGVEATSNDRRLNISYKISLRFRRRYSVQLKSVKSLSNTSSSVNTGVEILAEGIYDPETGGLCMVGCRYLSLNNQALKKDTMDCEILVNLQFPPLNVQQNKANVKGSIASARNKSDPLYFEPVSVTSRANYIVMERQSIWRMDLEILMALISNTLACVFVVFQLLYVKKHPGVLPFVSLLMLAILTLGHMIGLVLNFEALFFRSHNRRSLFLGGGGWLEVHEVIVRVVTMVAFLLQFRLLQLSWSRRMSDNNHKALWIAEKKALFVSLPLYIAGALIIMFASWRKNDIGIVAQYYSSFSEHQHSLWRNMRSYAGLILDGFLLPQILLNIFYNSRENALSRLFYIGLTFVRLVPHAYDLYRAHNYVEEFDGSYIYANPAADFYSTAWDVTIPFVGMLFAAIICLQQRLGGRCFLPRRFREMEVAYEKLPLASEE